MISMYVFTLPVPSFATDLCYAYDSEYLAIYKTYSSHQVGLAQEVYNHKYLSANYLVPFLFLAHNMEAWIYIVVFLHIYKHDKSMEGILTKQTIQKRNQKRLQLYSYVTKLILAGLRMIILNHEITIIYQHCVETREAMRIKDNV